MPIHYDRDLDLSATSGDVGAAIHAALSAHYESSHFVTRLTLDPNLNPNPRYESPHSVTLTLTRTLVRTRTRTTSRRVSYAAMPNPTPPISRHFTACRRRLLPKPAADARRL